MNPTDNRYIVAERPYFVFGPAKVYLDEEHGFDDDAPLNIGDLILVPDATPDEDGDVAFALPALDADDAVFSINRSTIVSVSTILAAYGALKGTGTPIDPPRPCPWGSCAQCQGNAPAITLAGSAIKPAELMDVLTSSGIAPKGAELIVAKAIVASA